MRNLYKKLPASIFLILHFTFLIAVIIEQRTNLLLLIPLLIISLLLGFFYFKKFETENSQLQKLDVVLVLSTILGALSTFWFNSEYDLGPVLSAGLVGFISAFFPFLNRKSKILRELPAAIYCGAFAGMTAPMLAKDYYFILMAGFFTGILLIISKRTYHGYGGKLGTIAFGGVAMVSLILFLL